jgi:hypothetical protein
MYQTLILPRVTESDADSSRKTSVMALISFYTAGKERLKKVPSDWASKSRKISSSSMYKKHSPSRVDTCDGYILSSRMEFERP